MLVRLREIRDSDLPVFFAHQNEPEAVHMAAFTAADPADEARFQEHWDRVRRLPGVINRTVLDPEGVIVGHAAVFGPPEEREVTYWIGQRYWGRGIATAALRSLLVLAAERPLHARAVADNAGSVRVLEKCGFVATGTDRGFAPGRGEEVDELLFTLY